MPFKLIFVLSCSQVSIKITRLVSPNQFFAKLRTTATTEVEILFADLRFTIHSLTQHRMFAWSNKFYLNTVRCCTLHEDKTVVFKTSSAFRCRLRRPLHNSLEARDPQSFRGQVNGEYLLTQTRYSCQRFCSAGETFHRPLLYWLTPSVILYSAVS